MLVIAVASVPVRHPGEAPFVTRAARGWETPRELVVRLVTDAEVVQGDLVQEVLPIELSTVQRAEEIPGRLPPGSRLGTPSVWRWMPHQIGTLMSFDTGFDQRPDLEQLS